MSLYMSLFLLWCSELVSRFAYWFILRFGGTKQVLEFLKRRFAAHGMRLVTVDEAIDATAGALAETVADAPTKERN